MDNCHSWVEVTAGGASANSESEHDTKGIGESDLEYCLNVSDVSGSK
jgi:hypothetical protein